MRTGVCLCVLCLAVSVFSDTDFLASLGLPLHTVSALLVPPLLSVGRLLDVGLVLRVSSVYITNRA